MHSDASKPTTDQRIKDDLTKLADVIQNTSDAFAGLANTVMLHPESFAFVRDYGRGAHSRAGRRRSRQCRGSRARNFKRATVRAKLGASPTDEASVLVDAVKSGAYAAAHRKGWT